MTFFEKLFFFSKTFPFCFGNKNFLMFLKQIKTTVILSNDLLSKDSFITFSVAFAVNSWILLKKLLFFAVSQTALIISLLLSLSKIPSPLIILFIKIKKKKKFI